MTALFFQPRSWRLSLKVPLLVSGLMIAIAVLISQLVLSRLASDQEANLRTLTGAYLDGLSAALTQPVMRGDVWETFDVLDRARSRYSGVAAKYVIVQLPDGRTLASSDPLKFPVQAEIPTDTLSHFGTADGLTIDYAHGRAWLSRTMQVEGHSIGRLLAEIDVSKLLSIRSSVLRTLIIANSALTILFAAIGYAASSRMLRPLRTLTEYVEQVRLGHSQPIPASKRRKLSPEFRTLFDRFDAMAHDLNEREMIAAQFAAQEKFAVLGKLAAGMAHEVNNPLGGLFNALDVLRRHGANPGVRESTLNLLQRGLDHIRNVVRANLVTYKPEKPNYDLTPDDLDDLRVLIEPEAKRRQLALEWTNDVSNGLRVSVGSVRQATLNLLLNACAAAPLGGRVGLRAIQGPRDLCIEVYDDGAGIAPKHAQYLEALADDAPSPGEGVGLWIVRRLVQREGGSIAVEHLAVRGTLVRVTWPFETASTSRQIDEPMAPKETVNVG